MMEPRILLLHNRYREPGGEERLVGQTEELLRDRGVECHLLARDSGGLSRRRAAAGMLHGGLDPSEVAATVRRLRANVVHAHNINPLFGARALMAAREAGAKVVLHLHNYRLFCAIGTCFRDGEPCSLCRGRNTWPGVRHRCRGSLVESAVYGLSLARHQRAVFGVVDLFVTPSAFAREWLEAMGLPRERTETIKNFVPAGEFAERSTANQGAYALYVGRLAPEKGADVVIAAAMRAKVPLIVAGAGPEAKRCKALAGEGRLIELVGRVDRQRLRSLRAGAAFAVLPSRWPEVLPFAAIEAMAAGQPVLASRVGGLPELLDERQLVPPGDERAWAGALEALWKAPAERRAIGEANIARARDELNADLFTDRLLGIYASVLSTSV